MTPEQKAKKKAYYELNKARILAAMRDHRQANPEQYKQKHKDYYNRNKERLAAYSKTHYENNREAGKAKRKEWYESNKEKHAAKGREYVAKNKAKLRAYWNSYQNEWRAKNRDHVRAERRKLDKARYKTVRGNLNSRMSCMIRVSLSGKGGKSWKQMIPYSQEELRRHIESLFTSGMNWERFLAGQIEIDHVIPRSKFAYESENDIGFKQCWSLENLQPLWKRHNRAKSDKIIQPSQISLGI